MSITGQKSHAVELGEQIGYVLGQVAFVAGAMLYPYERKIDQIWADALCPSIVTAENVLDTQSPGIVFEKLGTLYTRSIHEPDEPILVTPFLPSPFSTNRLTVHTGGVAYHPERGGIAVANVVSGYAGAHDRFVAACMTAAQINPAFQLVGVQVTNGGDPHFNPAGIEKRIEVRRLSLEDDTSFTLTRPGAVFQFRTTQPEPMYDLIRRMLRPEDEAVAGELLVVDDNRSVSGLHQLGVQVLPY